MRLTTTRTPASMSASTMTSRRTTQFIQRHKYPTVHSQPSGCHELRQTPRIVRTVLPRLVPSLNKDTMPYVQVPLLKLRRLHPELVLTHHWLIIPSAPVTILACVTRPALDRGDDSVGRLVMRKARALTQQRP